MKSILLGICIWLSACATLLAQSADSISMLPATDSIVSAKQTDSVKPVNLGDYLVKILKVKRP